MPVAPASRSRVTTAATSRCGPRASRRRFASTAASTSDVYSRIAPIGGLIQQEPRQGQPATENSDVWVLFDDDNLYVTCRCWEAHPDQIVANELRRDIVATGQHDHLTVALDTFLDRRNGYFFLVTANGGVFDALMTDERIINGDWNTVWNFRSGRFDGGWTVEMAIPFKSLRYRRRPRSGLGPPVAADDPAQERDDLPHGDAGGWGISAILRMSTQATLVGAGSPAARTQPRDQALRDHRRAAPTGCRRRPSRNDLGRRRGRRREVRHHQEPHARSHLQHRLRAGGGRPGAGEPDAASACSSPRSASSSWKGRASFAFGGVRRFGRSGPSNLNVTPNLFFSRRIGLNDGGREVPIIGGARLTGPGGPLQHRRAQHRNRRAGRRRRVPPRPADQLQRVPAAARHPGTQHDRRAWSRGGRIRSPPSGSNLVYGADALFNFYQFLNINAYVAKTDTPGLKGKDLSYRAQAAWDSDRYGLEVERLVVGDNFNPEIGFMRREDFRRNFAAARFSPRPRPATGEGDPQVQLRREPRVHHRQPERAGDARAVGESSGRSAERRLRHRGIHAELRAGPPTLRDHGGQLRAGRARTTSRICGWRTQMGQQHRVNGTATYEIGSFYGGDKRTVELRGPRHDHDPFGRRADGVLQLDRSARRQLPDDARQHADHLRDDPAHVRERAGAVPLRQHVVFDQRPLSLGIHPRQRAVRRLQRGPRHVSRHAGSISRTGASS